MGIPTEEARIQLRKIWTPKLEAWRMHVATLPTSVLITSLFLDGFLDQLQAAVLDGDLDQKSQTDVVHAASVAVADELDRRVPRA